MAGNLAVMPSYSVITYFLLLKFVTYCYAADPYTYRRTPTLFSYGKTKLVLPTYMPKLPHVLPTAAVFPLERSSTVYEKSLPFIFTQTTTQTHHVNISLEKNSYPKHSAFQLHMSTVHSGAPSSISSVYISSPYEFEITSSKPTTYQYSESSHSQNYVERAYNHIYQEHLSSDDIKHTRVVEKISTSLKPTPGPLTYHLPTINFHGFSDISGNPDWAALKSLCELPGNLSDTLPNKCKICTSPMENLSPFLCGLLHTTVPDFRRFVNRQFEPTNVIFQNLICSYCNLCLNVQNDCKTLKQRITPSPSQSEGTYAIVYSICKCLKFFAPHCQAEFRRLCALMTKVCSLVDDNSMHHRTNPIHLNSCCSNFQCGDDINSTYEKHEQKHFISELSENKVITSSATDRHVMEFRTAFVRLNPHLITNLKPRQSAYCRLCETTIFMKNYIEKDHHAIAVTSANLEFPEPQTRGTLSTSTSCSKFANSYQCQGKETSDVDLPIDDSFIPTTSPPAIVPVPCTKTVLFSTETPYLLSYEVMIDRTVYFSSTWSKQKISKSLSPTLFPEPKTVVSYSLHDLSPDYRTEKQVTLESSFKGFPDIMVTSTEIQSVIPIEFSKNA